MKKKIGRPPPKWIINLPKGDYFIEDVVKYSGIGAQTCHKLLAKYGAKCEYVKKNRTLKILFHWQGFHDLEDKAG